MAATTQVRLLVWTFARRSLRSSLRPTKLQLSARRTSSATSGVVPCSLGPDMERAVPRAIRKLPARGKRRNLKLPWLLLRSACRRVQLVSRFAAALANEAAHCSPSALLTQRGSTRVANGRSAQRNPQKQPLSGREAALALPAARAPPSAFFAARRWLRAALGTRSRSCTHGLVAMTSA